MIAYTFFLHPLDEQFLTLRVSWSQGRWHVAFQNQGVSSFDNPLCITTMDTVTLHSIYQTLPETNQLLHRTFTSSARAADGCLAAASLSPSTDSLSSVDTPHVLLLQYYGVLRAAYALAHRLWPNLPEASLPEQQLAHQLLQQTIWYWSVVVVQCKHMENLTLVAGNQNELDNQIKE